MKRILPRWAVACGFFSMPLLAAGTTAHEMPTECCVQVRCEDGPENCAGFFVDGELVICKKNGGDVCPPN